MASRPEQVTAPTTEPETDNPSRPSKKRRFHNKSRSGCSNCKKRKVKCDETLPTCGNCRRFELGCRHARKAPTEHPDPTSTGTQAAVQSIQSSPVSSLDPSPSITPRPRRRGRPRKRLPSTPPPAPLPAPSSALTSADTFSLTDLHLLSHYHLSTAATLIPGSSSPPSPSSWPLQALHLSFPPSACDWLIHFPLSLSAFHLARLQTSPPLSSSSSSSSEPGPLPSTSPSASSSSHLFEKGESHLRVGLSRVAHAVADLNASNAKEVFLATMLCCFCTWARGPEQGDLMLVKEEGEAVWWTMLRGLRAVLERVEGSGGFGDFFGEGGTGEGRGKGNGEGEEKGEAEGKGEGDVVGVEEREEEVGEVSREESEVKEVIVNGGQGLDWQAQFEKLMVRLREWEEAGPNAGALTDALEAMRGCFEATFGTEKEPSKEPARFEIVFAWLFRIGDEYITLLKGKDEAALVVLACFVLLMDRLPDCWFLEGWVEHILAGIKLEIRSGWEVEVEWVDIVITGK
ncbi:hypothetical protein KVT40_002572 [Elsinoe batatas]|uniref:Zn(2)-C6 fungal-type domain-containing protein n=1 Tax=Elsinoe batatas TaxID=2601811 RepID=A0A8K0L494_9PEZI|nr:hypothetical protein KVT40_002572 [Elsinoe batatas]